MAHSLVRQLPGARRWVAISTALGLLGTLLTIGQMGLLAHVTDRAFQRHAGLGSLAPELAALLGVILLRAAVTGLRETAGQAGARRAKQTLRAQLVAHLQRLGPLALKDKRTGDLVSLVGEGIERIDPYVARYLPQTALVVLTPLAILVAVAARDWISAIILLATAPILPLLMALVGRYAESHIQAQWSTLARMSAYLLDTLQGLTTIKILGRGAATEENVRRISIAYKDRTLRALRHAFLSSLVLEFITAGAIAMVAVVLGTRLLDGALSFETAFFVLLLVPEFYRPLRDLGQHRHAAMEAEAPMERIAALLASPATTVAPSLPADHGRRPSSTREPIILARPLQIALTGIGYCYPGSETAALSGIDLVLAPGTRTAVVGPSGAGKSTLVGIVLRFIEPTAGAITVNGVPLAALPVEDWRAHLAYVPQRPHLFAGSVAENIALGRPGASPEEVAWAAAMAGADQFIERLPFQYETTIGERGARLSGGEAQRIAIARAFLRDAPVLILDEPTSALDPVSEAEIRTALERLSDGRTVLVVAHRLNTVATADRIAVLDRGTLVELGAHRELIEQGGLYARLAGRSREAVTI
ncbi:MAG TPA: thiol reductant ABC exporter subunit CydD [Chloroflexota bacterium]|nr:thiol reductant ABC exporter subunit CydD [Chloroflexota bacterium]